MPTNRLIQKITFSISIPTDLNSKIEARAEANYRTKNGEIIYLLTKAINDLEAEEKRLDAKHPPLDRA